MGIRVTVMRKGEIIQRNKMPPFFEKQKKSLTNLTIKSRQKNSTQFFLKEF